MVTKTVSELRVAAEKLVAAAEQEMPSLPDRAALVDALAVDLGAADGQAVIVEDRLIKLEGQTQVLSEAVTAMTEAAVIAPPAKTFQMQTPETTGGTLASRIASRIAARSPIF